MRCVRLFFSPALIRGIVLAGCMAVAFLLSRGIYPVYGQTPPAPFYNPLYTKIVYPYQGQVIPDTAPVIQWTRSGTATDYIVEISTDSLFSPGLVLLQSTVSDTFLSASLPGYQAYYGRVTSQDPVSGGSFISAVSSFISFVPLQVPSLKAWYAADQSGGLNNSPLGWWPDLSGNGIHASNSNTAQQPLFLEDAIHGLPAVHFDGINDVLVSSLPSQVNTFDLFTLSTVSAKIGPFYAGNGGASGFGIYRNDSNYYGGLFGGVGYLKFGLIQYKGFQINEFFRQTGQSGYMVNGIQSGNILTLSPNNPAGNAFVGGVSAVSSFKGKIAELLLFDQALNLTHKHLIYKYLHDKYSPPPVDLGPEIICSGSSPFTLSVLEDYSSYEWSTGDTTPFISVDSSQWVTLVAKDVFGHQSEDSVYIRIVPQVQGLSLSDTFFCSGNEIILDAFIGDEFVYLWNGEGMDSLSLISSVPISEAGSYTAVITDSLGCSFKREIQVSAGLPPDHQLCRDTVICGNQAISLLPLPPGQYAYLWSTGDTGSGILVDSTGQYVVTVTDQYACAAVDTILVTVSGVSPEIVFSAGDHCLGVPAEFTGQVLSSDSIVSWQWDFGDGDTASQQSVSHLYGAPGLYTVCLEVLSAAGCPNVFSKSLEVFPLPLPVLSLDSACAGVERLFHAVILVPEGDTLMSCTWDFGDGQTSGLQSPWHTYLSPGNYGVSLEVITGRGCAATAAGTVRVVGFSDQPSPFQPCLPVQNHLTLDTSLVFTWYGSGNALDYRLQASQDVSFPPQSILLDTTTADTFLVLSVPQVPHLYWRVAAYNLCRDSIVGASRHLERFEPAMLPGMKAWYAADFIDQPIGTKVGSWEDISGYQQHAANSNQSAQPLLSSSRFNNKPTVIFDGTDDVLLTPLIFNSLDFDFIVVSTLAGRYGPYYLGMGNANGYGFHRQDSTAYGGMFGGASFIKFGNSIRKVFQVNEFTRSQGQVRYLVNQAQFGSVFGSTPFAPQGQGYLGGTSGTQLFKGNISELLCFDQGLSATQRDYLFRYLHDKYCPPPVDLGPERKSSYPLCPAHFSVDTNYVSYLWSNGDTSASTTYDSEGWVKVTVTDLFDVSSTDSVYLDYPRQIPADTLICQGDTVKLSAWFSAGYSYEWGALGQGVLSGDSAIAVSAEGIYWVRVGDSLGCSQTDTVVIQVDSFPDYASFGADTLSRCEGESLQLAVGGPAAVTYLWNDGSTEPELTVHVPGMVHVTVTNALGCMARDTAWLNLRGHVPLASFAADDSLCLGLPVQFTDLSQPAPADTNASIVLWSWDFGDTTGSSLQHPAHLYTRPGCHTAHLTVATDSGCLASQSQVVYVYPLPKPAFYTAKGCTGVTVPFPDQSIHPVGHGSAWSWDFGDPGSGPENVSSDSAAKHVYQHEGNYTVRLTVTSTPGGCTDSVARTVEIIQAPAVNFHYTQACEGEETRFSDITPLQPWNIVLSRTWDFGDGSPLSTVDHPEHTYAAADSFDVTLVLHTMQCRVPFSRTVAVYPRPVTAFNAADLCEDTPYQLADQSSISSGTVTAWWWELGTAGTSVLSGPVVAFANPGLQVIRLHVRSDKGCPGDTVSCPVEVFSRPAAGFGFLVNTSSTGHTVHFTDQSSEDVLQWNWAFGDGTGSGLPDPVHAYPDSGTYQSELVVVNVHGCTDTATASLVLLTPAADMVLDNIIHEADDEELRLAADLTNAGTFSLNAFELKVSRNGIPAFRETWTGTLPPDSSLRYYFHAGLDRDTDHAPYYYCIAVDLPFGLDDRNPSDNVQCRAVEEQFRLTGPFPNPAGDLISLVVILESDAGLQTEIFDSYGRNVRQSELAGKKGLNRWEIGVRELASGAYVLRVTTKEAAYLKRFVKE